MKIPHIQTNLHIEIPNILKDLRKSNQPSTYEFSPTEITFIEELGKEFKISRFRMINKMNKEAISMKMSMNL